MLGRGKQDPDERSAADRAAAAAERARRRGQSPPPMTHAAQEAAAAPPAPPRPEPKPEPRVEPVGQPVRPPVPQKPVGQPVSPPVPQKPVGQPVSPPVPPPHAEPEPEPPPRPRREPAPRLTSRPAPPAPRPPRDRRLPLRGGRELPPAARGPSRTGRRVVAGLVVLVVAALVFTVIKTFQPFHDEPSGLVRVTIPEGAGVGQIGDLLAERDVIDGGTFFALNAAITGRRGGLRPGDYTLQQGMTYGAVLDALARGPKAKVVKTFKLLLPEGFSIAEQAPRVAEGGVTGDYEEATASPKALRRARALGLPDDVDTTEGFMFPATYDLVTGATADQLVEQQLSAFADNFGSLDMRRARRGNLTDYEVLIIASMVEREAQVDRERPLIASVIYNRLREGMPLGIDATIRYHTGNWEDPILQSQLEEDTPYNTRINAGLPPTPIGNPGLASMEAAARPADTDYLYFVVKPGTCGEHAFSETEAEFYADSERYNAAREAAGGQSPTTC